MPQFLRFQVYKIKLENNSFQHVNAHWNSETNKSIQVFIAYSLYSIKKGRHFHEHKHAVNCITLLSDVLVHMVDVGIGVLLEHSQTSCSAEFTSGEFGGHFNGWKENDVCFDAVGCVAGRVSSL